MKHAWTVGRVVITVVIFAYVLRGFDLDEAMVSLRHFRATLIGAALLMIAVDRLLMYWRWALLVKAASPVPPQGLFRIFFVSSFVGSFLPAGVGGDAARAYQVGRQTQAVSTAIASVVVDRWLGLLAVGLAGCLGVIGSLDRVPSQLRELTVAMTLVLGIGAIATLFADRIVGALLPASWTDGLAGRNMRRLAVAVGAYRRHPAVLWKVFALSIVVQTVRISLAWLIGSGLGIDVPFSYYWVFMPFNILMILLPLSLGGFGLPQGTMVWTLGPLGVAATDAFLLSLLFVLAGVVGNLPGAVLYAIGYSDPGATRTDELR